VSDVLADLEAWCRKYYTATVVRGHFVQPGDEGYVELSAVVRGGRKIQVSEWDCPGRDEDEMPTATVADMIREALRLWDADPTPKRFDVMVSTAVPVSPSPPGCCEWTGPTYFKAQVVAANDAEAIEKAVSLFPPDAGARVRSRQSLWERGPAEGEA
jgi:hypothetical protein